MEDATPQKQYRHIHGEDDIDAAVAEVLDKSKHRVILVAPELRLPTFTRPSLRDRVRHLLTGHRDNRIQILVHDQRTFMRANSVMIDLVRRHSSRVTARCTPVDMPLPRELIVIVDDVHFVHQPNLDTDTATCTLYDPGATLAMRDRVLTWWDRATAPDELFRAGL